MIRGFGPQEKVMVWEKSAHENDRKAKYGGGEGTSGAKRDLLGYGPATPSATWPKNAKVALNFVINYEEGGEQCILHGDGASESLLSDISGAVPLEGQRNMNMESLYEYGARAGFWRLHRLFTKKKVPVTVFAVGMALERNPAVCHALKEQKDWEVASHGYRWQDYQNVDEDTEREHINRSIQIHERVLGKRPVGFYQGKPNENTRRLVVEEGGFKYDSDSYADDLPYWNMDYNDGHLHLVIPYTLDMNDMRFCAPNGYANGEDFARDLKENLRYLVDEGRSGSCKMMTVGLHCRLARPGRAAAVAEFLDFAKSYGREVWICTREEIADHWMEHHFPKGAGSPMKAGDTPSQQIAELDMKKSGGGSGEVDLSVFKKKEDSASADEDDGDII
mmetsp:Transcript_12380/g.16240  ORF Transcript_12380/g.16240 Transcript_12380/m.16240 type:complete len:391 (-) Transcript_12380:28-1200(-)